MFFFLSAVQPVTMLALLQDLQVDPKEVRWNEEMQDFE